MAKLGTIAFGGPAVHVAMLREETVRRRRWLEDQEFLDLFGAVSLLPGPSSTQLAIVLSRRRAGWVGLIVGGACFITPAMLIVLGLACAYSRYGTTPTGGGVIYGVEPVVIALVALALWELGRTAVKQRWYLALAVLALGGYLAGLNVLLILLADGVLVAAVKNRSRVLPVVVPVVAIASSTPTRRPGLVHIAAEFAKLGVVVFGSGYVLLAYLRRDLVNHLHWLSLRQVLDAVAAGQVTPGPVFTTATFVGYLLGGVPAALVATAGIFVPSFLMVSALEPAMGRIRRSPWTGAALEGITVAALGLMCGVAIDLGHTAIHDALTAALAIGAIGVLIRWRPNPVWVVAAGAFAGTAHALL
jgi:chromate transporter